MDNSLKLTYSHFLITFFAYLLLGTLFVECKQRRYNGDKILRVTVSNETDWETVESIMREHTAEDDIWSSPVDMPSFGDIRVSQKEYDIVTSQLKQYGLDFRIFIDNVQEFVDAEKVEASQTKSKPFRRKRATMSNQIIGTYATFDEIKKYIYDAERNFEIASVLKIGDSLEGRPMLVLKLGIPHPDPDVVKPVIWVDAGIHAREWIAPASLMYIIYQLLNGYHEKDPVIFDLLKRVDWMFLPVLNPDGYIYSHTNERLWRKNRAVINGSKCMGVDLNRNFDFHWGEETASPDPCDVMFRGVSPASEVETQVMQNFLLENRKSISVYISLHSYSQFWFSRWAYTDEEVANHDEMIGLARLGVEEIIKVNNARFKAGLSHQLMYGYSGGSPDWVHGVAGIPFSYTLELRDRGKYAFVLPTEYIMPSGAEIYAGIMAVGHYIKNVSGIMDTFNDVMPLQGDTPSGKLESDPRGNSSQSNSTDQTLPPFDFTETQSTTPTTQTLATSRGDDTNYQPPTQSTPRPGPIVQPPPVTEGETSGGRDQMMCTGSCLDWWQTINSKRVSRIPRFYRWLFQTSGRFGPWRTEYRAPRLTGT